MTLKEQLAAKISEARAAYEQGSVVQGKELTAQARNIKAAMDGIDGLGQLENAVRPTLPGVGAGAQDGTSTASTDTTKSASGDDWADKLVYTMRYGEEDAMKSAVYKDAIGADYRQKIWDQENAFAKWVRAGDALLYDNERRLLMEQIFPFDDIVQMVKNGYDIPHVKTTMIEAQGTLGGYAVPVTMQQEVIQRLPGLTAVRGNGARVLNLTTGNSTEILEITGADSDHRYTGALRGLWGAETQSPTEDNMTFGQVTLTADLYTYKTSMSQSLIDDASNIVDVMNDEIVTAFAIDEDEAFLIGDGTGKPLGIIPGSANTLSLTEVNSGNASALTSDGIKKLKRGLPSQYRSNAVWVGESDTYEDIELLKDGEGRYLYPDLTDEDMLLNRKAAESEAMPAVAANAFPLIFGDMRGYYIVQRSGMTIARFQDSNTGINKVEFHVRRRIGGRVAESFRFVLQKVAA